ncbi:hypothetical protein ACHWQZ_G013925 [Mnemiopsis leidyi]
MICLRSAMRCRTSRKKLILLGRRYRSSCNSVSSEAVGGTPSEIVAKIRDLYKAAYALTNGRPSRELLEALEQQAKIEGVRITGKELHDFEYEEYILQNKSKQSKIRPITGTSTTKVQLLNAYLDIFLNKNQLDEFLFLIQRSTAITDSIKLIDPSILMRYVIKCRRDFRVHHLTELPENISIVDKVMGHFYQKNWTLLQGLRVNQKFINGVVAGYSFYYSDFKDFEKAISIIDPSLVFSVTNEKLSAACLFEKYPLIKSLVSQKPNSTFPYYETEVPAASIKVQLQNEKQEFTQLQSVSCNTHKNHDVWKYKSGLQKKWEACLYKALLSESNLYKKGDHRDFRMHNCPFLDEDIVCLKSVARQTVNYICEQLVLQFKGIEILVSASAIGNIVYKIYCKQHSGFDQSKYEEYLKEIRNASNLSPQMVWEKGNTQKFHQFAPFWSTNTMNSIGGFILNLVRMNFKFDKLECEDVLKNSSPKRRDRELTTVFTHTYHVSDNTSHTYPVGTYVSHPVLKELITQNMETRGYFYFETTEIPMICPPKPWCYHSLTPMLLSGVQFIRYAGYEWKKYYSDVLNEFDRKGHIDVIKYGLDVLGTLPWKVNSKILEKQIEVFNAGGLEKLSIATVFDKEYPEAPNRSTVDEDVMKAYHQTYKLLKKEENEKHALRCTQLYTLSLANSLVDAPFWQCYNLDFRGRVYPVAPHFSQMLGDPARGMLMFSEGAPLGENGLRWLKVHCATTFGGLGKATFEEKERFVDDNIDNILKSADTLCPHQGWWAGSTEDPWQCLAACVELAAALRSPDPTEYVTCLPVHMDGSCNGLQHYAALGRDLEGAVKVCVAPSSRPEDVYIAVINIVLSLQEADLAAGNQTARKLVGMVERKTLKQTVMTQVYGVTQYGARAQIKGRLLDKGMSDSDATECASYLSVLTFKAVGQLFTQAQEIKNWLNKSAFQIAETGKPVKWSTPLGLPCVQPYTRNKRYNVMTPVQGLSQSIPSPEMPVNKRKQSTAFPPNFIHSQDSTHMLMTAIECYHAGIPFAAVHDSFWTLPCYVDEMNDIIREQFILMYSFDVLKQLKESFEEYNPEITFDDLPGLGDLDIDCVRDSTYFFS